MEATMESTTGAMTPPEEVDQLILMVGEEAGLKVRDMLDVPVAAKKTEEAQKGRGDECSMVW
ncbi:hypothetical protein EON63_24515 [archaeon]|nr:MAG: hypothetical protein EON63_24515 [archaeon]